MKKEDELPSEFDLRDKLPPVVDQGDLGMGVCCGITSAIQVLSVSKTHITWIPKMQKTKHENISKAISEYLRNRYGVKASHGREIAAVMLGHKSHASYLASKETVVKISQLEMYTRMKDRLPRLRGLALLPNPNAVVHEILIAFEELK